MSDSSESESASTGATDDSPQDIGGVVPQPVMCDGDPWLVGKPTEVALGHLVPLQAMPIIISTRTSGHFTSPNTPDFAFVIRAAIPRHIINSTARDLQGKRMGLNRGRQHIVGITAARGLKNVRRPAVAKALLPLAHTVWAAARGAHPEGAVEAEVDYRTFGGDCGYSSAAVNRGVGVDKCHEHTGTNASDVGLAVLRSHGSCLDFPRLGIRVEQADGDIIVFSPGTWHANVHSTQGRLTVAFFTVRRVA